jgi:hypothetical protein
VSLGYYSWDAASGATSYQVYSGYSNPPAYWTTTTTNSVSWGGSTLPYNTTCYWRIDAVNAAGTTSGTVWKFTTEVGSGSPPGGAYNYSPNNGATDVSTNPTLSWSAGTGATSHDIYFSTDSTVNSSDFKGNQSGTTYNPGTLTAGQTYWWRIDEVNAYGTTPGNVKSFTTEYTQSGWFGYLYVYFEGSYINDIPSVAGYTNMNHMLVYPGDMATGIQTAIANGTKLMLDVKWLCFEEPVYHDFQLRSDWSSQLDTFKALYDQYKDHIVALTPMDEPYWHGVQQWEVEAVAAKLRTDFPGIPIYLNLYKSGFTSLTSYPAGIDWVAFDNIDNIYAFDYNEFLTCLNHLKSIKTSSQKIILNTPNINGVGTDSQMAGWSWNLYSLMQNDPEIIGMLVWLGDSYRAWAYGDTALPLNQAALESIGHAITGK